MPRLVRRLEFPPERRLQTREGEDIDLRWNPETGTVELTIAVGGDETVLDISRESLHALIELAQEAERALNDREGAEED